jgi:hypothetical protein
MELVAGLVLEDGRTWADVATPWQVGDAQAILEPAVGDPLWHFLTRPRGGSKSTDLAAVLLAWLATQASAGARGYLAASDVDQAALVVDAAAGLVQRSPGLRQLVRVDARRFVSLASGAVVEALASDGASAYGLRPAFVVADEIAQWPGTRNARQVWAALVSAMGKVPGSRLVCLTSAGDPSHWSAKVLGEARRSPRWRVHEIGGPLPWVDAANLEAQRKLLLPSEYARLHENRWVSSEDALVSPDDLAACVAHTGHLPPQPGRLYVTTLDIGLKNDRTVSVVAHRDGDTVVVDRVDRWQGSRLRPVKLDVVEAHLLEVHAAYGGKVVADPWQGAQLCQRLRDRGLHVEEFVFSAQSVGRIAGDLFQALRQHRVALPDDEDLLDELGKVRLVPTNVPGQVRLDHLHGEHDDMAVATGLAVHHLAGLSMEPTINGWLMPPDLDDGLVDERDPWGTQMRADYEQVLAGDESERGTWEFQGWSPW